MFSQLHLWTFIAKVPDVTLISFDTSYLSFHQTNCTLWNGISQNVFWYPFFFKKTQIPSKQTNETHLIRKPVIPYVNINFRYFRPSITKVSSSSCSWRVRRVSCSLILEMKLVPPPLPRSSYVPLSFWLIL
jgi:hypothetical protein